MKKKRVCIDVGGTFTDCLVMDETGLLQKFKAATTPSDPSIGLMDAMKKAARFYAVELGEFLGQIDVLVHGTTLATNILLTGRGAKARMITTSAADPSSGSVLRKHRQNNLRRSVGIMVDGVATDLAWRIVMVKYKFCKL
jgi:predicted NBD/HSP70 family sugar kinase